MRGKAWLVVLAVLVLVAGGWAARPYLFPGKPSVQEPPEAPEGLRKATFGGGCFWCTEAVFLQLAGVESVVSGFSGGHVENPTYRQVCGGDTGHAECVQITFDPKVISYEDLLDVFFQTHDPTTPNRQGNDVGPHYRSVIFYHSEQQKEQAERFKKQLDRSGEFAAPIVTEIAPFTAFYRAEDYHQDYFANNPAQPYCRAFIPPKLDKLRKRFKDKLK